MAPPVLGSPTVEVEAKSRSPELMAVGLSLASLPPAMSRHLAVKVLPR